MEQGRVDFWKDNDRERGRERRDDKMVTHILKYLFCSFAFLGGTPPLCPEINLENVHKITMLMHGK